MPVEHVVEKTQQRVQVINAMEDHDCLFTIILSFSILAMLAAGRVYFPAHLTLGLVTDLLWPMECAQMSGMP